MTLSIDVRQLKIESSVDVTAVGVHFGGPVEHGRHEAVVAHRPAGDDQHRRVPLRERHHGVAGVVVGAVLGDDSLRLRH